jgi:glycosyltransferase involved in cell wall biosynthesis
MTDTARCVSIIIPASNEASELPGLVATIVASDPPHIPVEIVIVSNGSRDGTAEVARGLADAVEARGWSLVVLDLPEGSKIKALNAGDQAARGDIRIYVDADIRISPRLLAGLARAVDRPEPAFAGGRPAPLRAQSALTRAYTRLWLRVPFMTRGVPGCGVIAVNRAGRSRWSDWPNVVGDDTFARLQFASHERHMVEEAYSFPMAEGFSALVRVRQRQNEGVKQVMNRFPDLERKDDKAPLGLRGVAALAFRDPLGFVTYAGISLAVRFSKWDGTWSRGR